MYASESASMPINSGGQDAYTTNYNVTFGGESSGTRRLSDPVRVRIWGPPTVRSAGNDKTQLLSSLNLFKINLVYILQTHVTICLCLCFQCIDVGLVSLTADPGGPGICAFILTLFSFLLILATFPLSLCFSVKVSGGRKTLRTFM